MSTRTRISQHVWPVASKLAVATGWVEVVFLDSNGPFRAKEVILIVDTGTIEYKPQSAVVTAGILATADGGLSLTPYNEESIYIRATVDAALRVTAKRSKS